MGDHPYHDAVALFRDMTDQDARFFAAMMGGKRIAGLDYDPRSEDRPMPPLEEQFKEIEAIEAAWRPAENAALITLHDLALAYDEEAAFDAIEEAGAFWLYEALLRRAAQSASQEPDPTRTCRGGEMTITAQSLERLVAAVERVPEGMQGRAA